jgi:hypothetical protein
MRSAIPALAALLALSSLSPLSPLSQAAAADATTTYTDPQYGFSLHYPVSAAVETDTQENGQLDIIPVAAIVVTPDLAAFKGTNLGDASVSVGVSEDTAIVAACDAAKAAQGEKAAGALTLGGVKFAGFTFEDAAMGNRYASTLYRAVDGGACYEIAEFLHWAAIENFSPGAIKEFDRAKIEAELHAITRSFALKRK